jgi:hypothetical protein
MQLTLAGIARSREAVEILAPLDPSAPKVTSSAQWSLSCQEVTSKQCGYEDLHNCVLWTSTGPRK